MGLRTQFNIVLIAVFLFGFIISGIVSYGLLQKQAREETVAKVNLMMSAAKAVRDYTIDQVAPRLRPHMEHEFFAETVPAYAATTTIARLPAEYQDYSYREATLNPTNPRHRALDWEADVIRTFAQNADLTEIVGERQGAQQRILYLARPLRITNEGCLTCHSTPSVAPASMIAKYGDDNGFGWEMNEVVAAQIGTVPMQVSIDRANQAFFVFMASLAGVFVFVFAILNWMLSRLIVRPIRQMAGDADRISTGDFDVPEFSEGKSKEVSQLGTSFNRMRRSLQQALSMIDS
jgi:protein-histidine pros-kinase